MLSWLIAGMEYCLQVSMREDACGGRRLPPPAAHQAHAARPLAIYAHSPRLRGHRHSARQVPANRLGHVAYGGPFTAPQLKVTAEFISLAAFAAFSSE